MIKKFKTTRTVSLNEFLRGAIAEIPEIAKKTGEAGLNSKIRRLIVAGCVKVNGRVVVRPGFELRGKSEIVCEIDEEKFFYEKQPDDIDFTLTKDDVLFEDEYIICVNKPAFLPVEQTITGNRKNLHDAVVDYLWKQNPSLRNPPYAGIMHRLDRETSGVILFTKQRSVNKNIFEQFENHTIQKTYLAVATLGDKTDGGKQVCDGKFYVGKSFIVEKHLGRISPKSQEAKWGIVEESKGGLYAKTEFEILGVAPNCLNANINKVAAPNCLFTEENISASNCLTTEINKVATPNRLNIGEIQSFQNHLFTEKNKSLPENAILIQCRPLTGRTHQIRVHLSSIGLPILGDTLYGGLPYNRIMLHAESLEFTHPVSGMKYAQVAEGNDLNNFL